MAPPTSGNARNPPHSPWSQGRTASPVPIRRVVGPRQSQPGAAGITSGLTRLENNPPSPSPAPPEPSQAEVRAAEKAAFLAERKRMMLLAKEKQLRLSNRANMSNIGGERLDGLLVKAEKEEAMEVGKDKENSLKTNDNVPFAGHLKGSKPKRNVGRGAPRCASSSKKKVAGPSSAKAKQTVSAARASQSAKSRGKARMKGKRDADRKAHSATKGHRIAQTHRNSSRVLAPPGGFSSISFN